jgi:hypothetical protein
MSEYDGNTFSNGESIFVATVSKSITVNECLKRISDFGFSDTDLNADAFVMQADENLWFSLRVFPVRKNEGFLCRKGQQLLLSLSSLDKLSIVADKIPATVTLTMVKKIGC